jgi:hypothetical protein
MPVARALSEKFNAKIKAVLDLRSGAVAGELPEPGVAYRVWFKRQMWPKDERGKDGGGRNR